MSESRCPVTQPRTVRLLSLDGGGVRGLSSLLILQRMMEMISPSKPPKPCEYFDLIGGTSTGGLIAVMLGRLRMHVSEAIDVYLKLSQDVFQPRRNQIDILARARDRVQLRGRFDGDALAKAVRDIVQKSGEAAEALLIEPQEGPCKVFVCSILQEVSQPVLLRSYPSPGVASQLNCKIWEACRATSAATSFFDPIGIGPFGQQFSDGATGCNNPVRQVYSEARRLWPDSKIQCLVSVGTGKPRLSAFGDGLKDVARTLVRTATDTELTAEEFLQDHADLGLADSYFRFNVPQGLEGVGLQEYTAVPTIASATMVYLESQQTSQEVIRCVRQLQVSELEAIVENLSLTVDEDLSLTADEEKWLHSLYITDTSFHRSTISTALSGTCRWFLQHSKYINWRDFGHSNLLWISGDPGCGKSVLSSFLIDQLTANPPYGYIPETTVSVPYVILYFFCDDKIQEHRDAPAIVRGILHQLVANRPGLIKRHFKSRFKSRGTAVANELMTLWYLFVAVCQDRECPPIIVVIDALDECEERSRSRFLSLIATFFSNRTSSTKGNAVKILITSRPEISIADSLEALEEVRLKAEDETESISKDVVLVTQERLRATLQRFNPPAHIVQSLTERLTRRAGHTFLWVSLMLQMIERSAEASEDALNQILDDLPDELDGVYEKILARVQGRNRQKARTVLEVIVAASRPLRLAELNFAISVRSGDTTLDDFQTRLEPNLPRTLQLLCGPFLKITNSTVTLVHQTAKEFLLRVEGSAINSTSWKHTLDPAESHLTIARGCLLALSENQTIYHPGESYFATYALEFWIIHLLECEEKLDSNLVDQVIALHTATQTSQFGAGTDVLPNYLTKGSHFPHTPLSFASLCGFRRIIERLVNDGHAINESDHYGWTAIDYSALSGRSSAVDILLQLGAKPKPSTIQLAVKVRSPDVVAALLRSGEILLSDSMGRDQMILAVETGHEELTKILVKRGVRTDMRLNEGGDTPLIMVVKGGNARLVKALAPGSVHVQDNMGRTAVQWAAEYGYETIVRMLIASGATVNGRCDFGETPLLRAVKGRHLGVVRFLLNQRADANIPDGRGSTPLWWATISGDETLVRALLPVTCISDIKGPESLSWWAQQNGHIRIAEILKAHQPRSAPLGPLSAQVDSPANEYICMNMCVAARINGYDTRAVISTGAGATFVSESFARATKLLVLVDKRFAGTARGVGRAKVIGRVHSAQIQLGTDEGVMMPTAITVLESSAWREEEILLGLDFLKRYRCTVDFRRNKLILPLSKTTVPMFEDSVRRIGREGGWILA